jgi:hypothetical protein
MAAAAPPPLPVTPPPVPTNNLTLHGARYAHAVNSRAALLAACSDPAVTFLEGDVVLGGADGRTPVMGHEPATASDLPLAEWLRSASDAGKGVKVDVKRHDAVDAVLAAVVAHDDDVHRSAASAWPLVRLTPRFTRAGQAPTRHVPAVIINADVLAAEAAGQAGCAFNAAGTSLPAGEQAAVAAAFLEAVGVALPSAVVSLGWTTGEREGGRYTHADVDAMLALVHEAASCGVPVTFPVRASFVVESWGALARLLEYPSTSLTVWSNTPLSAAEEAWLRATLPPLHTAFDMPPPLPPQPLSTAARGSPLAAWVHRSAAACGTALGGDELLGAAVLGAVTAGAAAAVCVAALQRAR